MCFGTPNIPAAVAPAPAAPAPSPLAVNQSPTGTRDAEDVSQYGAGGQPNLARPATPVVGSGSTAGGSGVGTPGGGGGLAAM